MASSSSLHLKVSGRPRSATIDICPLDPPVRPEPRPIQPPGSPPKFELPPSFEEAGKHFPARLQHQQHGDGGKRGGGGAGGHPLETTREEEGGFSIALSSSAPANHDYLRLPSSRW